MPPISSSPAAACAPRPTPTLWSSVALRISANMTEAPKNTPAPRAGCCGPRGRRLSPRVASSSVTDRPALAGALGALVIAFSAILVRLAEVSPSTAAVFRCVYALPALGAAGASGAPSPRARARLATACSPGCAGADLRRRPGLLAPLDRGRRRRAGHRAGQRPGGARRRCSRGWSLGERPAAASLASIPVVLFGVVLITGAVGAGAYGDDPALGAIYGLAHRDALLAVPADPAAGQRRRAAARRDRCSTPP